MSYDFRLRLPDARRPRKGKLTPEQQARLDRARERLLAFDPDMGIESDDGDRFTANSSVLGDVFVRSDRVELGLSMAAEPRDLYQAIHGLMRCFDGEGYVADDPQLGDDPVYHPDFVTFMRQYRRHFACSDDEFAQWCSGETPPAWAEREALRERGAALAAGLPKGWERTWEEHKTMSDEELWAHLQDVIRRNDEAIAQHGLGEYLLDLSHASAQSGYGHRRLDGSFYPIKQDAPWFEQSLLRYESHTIGVLQMRGFAPVVCSQPQRVLVVFNTSQHTRADWDAMAGLMRSIHAQLKAAALLAGGPSGFSEQHEFNYDFTGTDADAIHAALARAFEQSTPVRPLRFVKRHGGTGAREEVIPL